MERSGTPGSVQYLVVAHEVGDSPIADSLSLICAIARFARFFFTLAGQTWGSSPLHPRLYAFAALRGLRHILNLMSS